MADSQTRVPPGRRGGLSSSDWISSSGSESCAQPAWLLCAWLPSGSSASRLAVSGCSDTSARCFHCVFMVLLSPVWSNPFLDLFPLSASTGLVAAVTTCCLKIHPFICFILFPTSFLGCPLVLVLWDMVNNKCTFSLCAVFKILEAFGVSVPIFRLSKQS